MFLQVRSAHPEISVGGKGYYQSLAPYFLSLTYTDSSDGDKADDLQFSLADRDRRFINDWMPDIGTTIDVFILAERWFSPIGSALRLDCGKFWIDSVEFELPQHTVSVKASSIPTGVRIKATTETRGWEKNSLKKIAEQIAEENKMDGVDWLADGDPKYSRVEQVEESALAFLRKRADDAKLQIKVHRNRLVIFDPQKLEEEAPKFNLIYGDGASGPAKALGAFAPAASGGLTIPGGLSSYRISGGKFNINLTDGLKKTKVKQTNVGTGLTSTGKWEDKDFAKPGDVGKDVVDPSVYLPKQGAAPVGTGTPTAIEDDVEDQVNESTDSDEEGENGEGENGNGGGNGSTRAEGDAASWSNDTSAASTTKAKSHMRKRNKDSKHAEVELSIGNPLIASGQTFNLVGVGQYDGKWFIETVEHSVGPEYNTKLKIRRCLNGY